MRAGRPGSNHSILFFLLVAGAATLAPSSVHAADRAQRVARVAFVDPYSASITARETAAFWARLQELGWVQGQNLVVETRSAEGQIGRLPTLMADVVAHKVDVIVTRGTPAATAAKSATTTIPIVVASMGDPVGTGLVTSLAHPEGNLTGLSLEGTTEFYGKYLDLLREIIPRLSAIAVIANLDSSSYPRKVVKYLGAIAQPRGVKVLAIDCPEPRRFASAFKQARRQAQAALVLADPVTITYRADLAQLAASNHVPTVYAFLPFAEAGGLMAYGADPITLFPRAADYVDKILRGAKPADLPIEQPTQFKLVVNLKAARALGLTFPESILLRADEVIR